MSESVTDPPWRFDWRLASDSAAWEVWDVTDPADNFRVAVFDSNGASDDFNEQYARIAAEALNARRFGVPRDLEAHPERKLTADDRGSITLDNASVQRLMDYGVFHYTDDGWHVGRWPKTNTPSTTALKPLDDILHDWEHGTMDAAGTIEDLVALIDRREPVVNDIPPRAKETSKERRERRKRNQGKDWASA